MKNNSLRAKNSFFVKYDLILYSAIVVLTALLFAVFVLPQKNGGYTGFKVECDGETVLSFTFESSAYSVSAPFKEKVGVIQNGELFVFTVYFDEKATDFNEITADARTKTVKVTKSTCSDRKDCVYSSAISGASGVIVCAPHKLKITATGLPGFSPPSTGG